jgi:hypothetical protein
LYRYILIPDLSSNSLHFVSEDSFTTSTVSLFDGWGSKAISWPRSIAVRRSHSSEAEGMVVIYAGELLGKIWRIELDVSTATQAKISLER